MKKSNKILAVLMALVMIITAVPMMTVSADDDEKHEHVYVIQNQTEGSCTEAAKTTFKCACGDVQVMTTGVAAHIPAAKGYFSKDDTYHSNYCTVCKKMFDEKHDFYEVYAEWVQPTCEKAGKEVYKCRYCEYKKTVTIEPSVHIPSGKIVSDADKHGFICIACEKLIDENHVWDDGVAQNIACGDDGKVVYTCKVPGCNKTKEVTVSSNCSYPDKEDIEDGFIPKVDKFDEKGHTYECYYCSKDKVEDHEYVVEYTYGEVVINYEEYSDPVAINPYFAEAVADVEDPTDVPSTDEPTSDISCENEHTWGDPVVTKAATCTEDGEEVRTCTVCGSKDTTIVLAKGKHTWNEWEITQATCLVYGCKLRTCKECDETDFSTIPATGRHSYEWKETDEGHFEYRCAECHYLKAEKDVETKLKTPTCKDEGEILVSCKYCNYSYTAVVDTVDHKLVKDAKFTKFSKDHHKTTCVYCGEVKMPHTWGEWKVTVPATTEKEGTKTRTCADCGETDTATISKLTMALGDVNGDGNVTAIDARIILQSVAELRVLTEKEKEAADMNNDGYVTAVDARIILQKVAAGE